jgi:hypothetical protein
MSKRLNILGDDVPACSRDVFHDVVVTKDEAKVSSLLREWREERAALDAYIAELAGVRKRQTKRRRG